MNYYKIHRKLFFIIILFLLINNSFAWEIKDDSHQHFSGINLPKIVTLAPHLTELAFSAGLAKQLVGVSEYSDYPSLALKIPRIGNAWTVNFEKLLLLKPDLIIAWENGSPKGQIQQLKKFGFRVVLLKSHTLTDPARHLQLLSQIAPKMHEKNSQQLAKNYLSQLSILQKNKSKKNQKTFYLISQNPIYTVSASSTIGQVISFCGGNNIFANLKLPAPEVNIEAIIAHQPSIILHSMSDPKAQHDLSVFWHKWLPKTKLFYVMEDPLVRPSLRLIQGIEAICHAIK